MPDEAMIGVLLPEFRADVLRLARFRSHRKVMHLAMGHARPHFLGHRKIRTVFGGLHQMLLRQTTRWHDWTPLDDK